MWDIELKGFGLKTLASGRKMFYLMYRPRGDSKAKKLAIGRYGDLTTEQAREIAREHRGAIATGSDPSAELAGLKAAPTVAVLAESYLTSLAGKRAARTVQEYTRQFRQYILPRLGPTKAADVTRSQVSSLHQGLKDTPYLANRVLALLSAFFTWATRHGYRADDINPCKHVERYPEEGRDTFLTSGQLTALGAALDLAEEKGLDPTALA
ncbi:MAG: Arm DNA-binding domain-containing protein, partial [Gemmatimonadota bacterium]